MFFKSKDFLFTAVNGEPNGDPFISYRVLLKMASLSLDGNGDVMPSSEFDKVQGYINNNLNNKELGEVFEFPVTPESIAEQIYSIAYGLWGDLVYEVEVERFSDQMIGGYSNRLAWIETESQEESTSAP